MKLLTFRGAVLLRLGAALMVAWAALCAPGVALADPPQGTQPTAIGLAGPSNAELGQTITLKARLVDPSGAPFPKATVYFTSPDSFLHTDGDIVLAEATTDAQGVAVADIPMRRSGALTINAEFRGDATYAASKASLALAVGGAQQLYQPDIGVVVPGVNEGPWFGPSPLPPYWPLTGWPIAAVMAIVWTCFGLAVFFMSRIPGMAGDARGATPTQGPGDAND